jgi:hypothetical protein
MVRRDCQLLSNAPSLSKFVLLNRPGRGSALYNDAASPLASFKSRQRIHPISQGSVKLPRRPILLSLYNSGGAYKSSRQYTLRENICCTVP